MSYISEFSEGVTIDMLQVSNNNRKYNSSIILFFKKQTLIKINPILNISYAVGILSHGNFIYAKYMEYLYKLVG